MVKKMTKTHSLKVSLSATDPKLLVKVYNPNFVSPGVIKLLILGGSRDQTMQM